MKTRLYEDFASAVSKVKPASGVKVQSPGAFKQEGMEEGFIGRMDVDTVKRTIHVHPVTSTRWHMGKHGQYTQQFMITYESPMGQPVVMYPNALDLKNLDERGMALHDGWAGGSMVFTVLGRTRSGVTDTQTRLADAIRSLSNKDLQKLDDNMAFRANILIQASRP